MRLKELRKSMKVSQHEVASELGITVRAYQNYEYGVSDLSTAILCKLADYFGVTTDYLLGREPADPAEDKLSQDESSLIDRYRSMTDEHKRFIETATMVVEEAERNKV